MKTEKLLQNAKDYFEKKEYSKAKKVFDEILQITSNDNTKKKTYHFLAKIAEQEGYYLKSIEYLKRILDYNLTKVERVKFNYKIGKLYILKQDELNYPNDKKKIESLYSKAKNYFKRSLNKNYKEYYIDSSIFLGQCYEMLNEYKKAIKILKKLDDNYDLNETNQKEVNVMIGACYFDMEEYDRAIRYLEKVDRRQVDYNTLSAIKLLGKSYYLVGENWKAVEELFKIFIHNQQKPQMVEGSDIEVASSILEEVIDKIFAEDKNIQEKAKEIIKKMFKPNPDFSNSRDKYVELCLELNHNQHNIRKGELINGCKKALSFIDKEDERYNKLKKKIKKLE